jgi:hypothetical protein
MSFPDNASLTAGREGREYVRQRNARGYQQQFPDHASYLRYLSGVSYVQSQRRAASSVTSATVPDVPSITIARGNRELTVTVTPPTNNGGSPITGYKYSLDGGAFQATSALSNGTFTITGLTNGRLYTVSLLAFNAVGDGPASAPVSGTPATVPDAPTNVRGTPGNKKAIIEFNAPANNGGAAIDSYTVTSSPDGKIGTGVLSPIEVRDLTNGTAYTFTVIARNSVGDSDVSTASAAVTPSAPALPMMSIHFDPSNQSSYPGTGSTVTSIGASGVTATIDGSVSFTNAVANGIFNFNGGNLTLANFDFGSKFTVIAWINAQSKTSINALIANETSGNNTSLDGFKLGWNSWNTKNNFLIFEGKGGGASSGVDSITYDTFQQIAYVLDTIANTITFYNNAQQVGTQKALPAGLDTNTTKGVKIGAFTDGFYTMKGYLADIRIYTDVMTQGQIQTVYDDTRGRYGL